MHTSAIDYEDLLLVYHSAASAVTDAVCSMDDPEASDAYIRGRLFSAAYDIAEVVLRVNGANVPSSMLDRTVTIRTPKINGIIPHVCDKLLDRALELPREELSGIAQSIDCWLIQVKQKYPEVFNRYTLCASEHSLVS